jgi:hypothetical protein
MTTDVRERKRDKIRRRLSKITERDVLSAMKETIDKGFEIFKGKLADYGVGAFKEAGAMGTIVKIREKYARFDNLMKKDGEPNFEGIVDSAHDLAWWAMTFETMVKKGYVDLDDLREDYRKYFGDEDDYEEES